MIRLEKKVINNFIIFEVTFLLLLGFSDGVSVGFENRKNKVSEGKRFLDDILKNLLKSNFHLFYSESFLLILILSEF